MAKNYCPFSLFSVVSKIFQKCVNNGLVDHFKRCGLFSELQCGVRFSFSAPDLPAVVSDRIARPFNRSGAILAVAFDIFKAFKMVWHFGLL